MLCILQKEAVASLFYDEGGFGAAPTYKWRRNHSLPPRDPSLRSRMTPRGTQTTVGGIHECPAIHDLQTATRRLPPPLPWSPSLPEGGYPRPTYGYKNGRFVNRPYGKQIRYPFINCERQHSCRHLIRRKAVTLAMFAKANLHARRQARGIPMRGRLFVPRPSNVRAPKPPYKKQNLPTRKGVGRSFKL